MRHRRLGVGTLILIAFDPLALIKIEGDDFPTVPVGNSDELKIGSGAREGKRSGKSSRREDGESAFE